MTIFRRDTGSEATEIPSGQALHIRTSPIQVFIEMVGLSMLYENYHLLSEYSGSSIFIKKKKKKKKNTKKKSNIYKKMKNQQ